VREVYLEHHLWTESLGWIKVGEYALTEDQAEAKKLEIKKRNPEDDVKFVERK